MVRFEQRFPVTEWLADMKRAADHITRLGGEILANHLEASQKGAKHAAEWKLEERWRDAEQSLCRLIESVQEILISIDDCHAMLIEQHDEDESAGRSATYQRCSDNIEHHLPLIEHALVELRHSALDLLRWAERSAKLEGSELPVAYRSSFAELVAYTPMIRPLIDDLLVRLHRLAQGSDLDPEVHRLQVLVERYAAFGESARGFIQSVVDPPLKLVFHETESFDEDLRRLTTAQVSDLATEVNDCCQLLLYDPAEFARRVQQVGMELEDDVDSSLVVLPIGEELKVTFAVDEDPVFEQMVVTLLHALPVSHIGPAKGDVLRSLYQHFSDETFSDENVSADHIASEQVSNEHSSNEHREDGSHG